MRITKGKLAVAELTAAVCLAWAPATGPAVASSSAVSGGSAAGITAGSDSQNGTAIYKYLRSQGYTPMQAAGAVCSMWGESTWNPESWAMDSNGLYSGGIMAWNGSNYPNYTGQSQPSGSPTADLQRQLPAIVSFVNGTGKQGYVSMMSGAATVLAASQIWSADVEEAGVSDAHPAGAQAAARIAKAADGASLTAY